METRTEHTHGGSWITFFFLSAALVLIAVIVSVFSMRGIDRPVEVSMVRVANGSGLPLHNVRINSIHFGDVPVNGVSGYRALAPAYRYAALRLEAAGKKFEMIPDDYAGETPLGRGFFTYMIQLHHHKDEMYFVAQDAGREERLNEEARH